MPCECQSGQRVLRVQARHLTRDLTELLTFHPGGHWELDEDAEAIDVQIGGDAPWQTVRDVVNFLRTILDDDRLKTLRAHWLPQCGSGGSNCSGGSNGSSESGADPASLPLMDMAPLDATPLVDVLRRRAIESWFQPVVRVGDHRVWGYECLMRGRSPEGNLVSSGDLLQWARQERLTFMLDRICRETHIQNAAEKLPDDVAVLINFLPTAIYEPSFCLRTTRNAAATHGLDPSRIVFEVVESEEVNDREHLSSILGYYRREGFRVALDDVGAGFAGLSMMADLNPDLIKIDRELASKACTSKPHRLICNALAQMARDGGKLCLAEGIETREELRVVEDLGVDLVQGYYFAKPSPEPLTNTNLAQKAAG